MKNEPTARKQHPVPQNIMEVEFKLIGDMTVRQFAYVGGAALVGFLVYSLHLPSLLGWTMISGIALLGLGLAFLPVEERGLDEWIRNFFTACYSPTQRLWGKAAEAPAPSVSVPKPVSKPGAVTPPVKAPAPVPAATPAPAAEVDPRVVQQKLREAVTGAKEGGLKGKRLEKRAKEASLDLDRILGFLRKRRPVAIDPHAQEENAALKTRLESVTEEMLKLKKQQAPLTGDANRTVTFYEERIKTLEEKNRELAKMGEELKGQGEQAPAVAEMGLNFQKQLAELTAANEALRQKALAEAKALEGARKAEEVSRQAYEQRLEDLAHRENELKRLEDERNRAVSELAKAENRMRTLEQQAKAPSAAPAAPPPQPAQVEPKIGAPEAPKRPEEKLPPIIEAIPNVINGVIKDQTGKLLPEIMVLVEDETGDPVRALKTNKLGQFAISTPLPNGFYTVKVVSKGWNFMPVNIKVDGTVLSPIGFRPL